MNGETVPVDEFQQELLELLNKHSKENDSDTSNFILAEYLTKCLQTWNYFTRYRDEVLDAAAELDASPRR